MTYFEAGFTAESGEAEIGFVVIEQQRKRVKVTLVTDKPSSRVLGSFTNKEWRDQGEVNRTLRGRGLLWRRSVPEGEYHQRIIQQKPK